MSGPNAPYTGLDFSQVIRQCYDEVNDRLRVDATVSVVNTIVGEVSVEINAADGDNIALSDGVNNVTITNVGSKYGLDVNLVNVASSPTIASIQNINLTTAGTEYSCSFPINTKRFKIKVRGSGRLQFSYTSGTTNTNYVTLFPGDSYEEDNLLNTPTIYFQSNKNSEILEVLSWS